MAQFIESPGLMRRCRFIVLWSVLLPLAVFPAAPPEHFSNAAIACAHPLATQAGYQILKKGGNAFDAAVAVAAVLAVVEPYSSGLGGGGFWLLHRANDGKEVMLDARETAPGKAAPSLYLDERGEVISKAALRGPIAAAIPGTPAALDYLARHYGRLPLKVSLAAAIGYARSGFAVDARYAALALRFQSQLTGEGRRLLLDYGSVPQAGFVLKQKGLAATLQAIASKGDDGFYQGRVAQEMVAAVQAGGGIWELDDLKNYRVIERRPIQFAYRSLKITAASLPSAGGLTLAQSLNILSVLPFETATAETQAHFVAEALRRAYQDRARYLGDADFVSVPVEQLLSKDYAASRAVTIDPEHATPSVKLGEIPDAIGEGADTTHFSIVDRQGNRVAATLSINTPFGSGFVAGNTGVLLNNEMDDFSVAPGVPNAYRLQGFHGNEIAPGKRPLSSMSPTFVEDERGILILGTPGGSRIISMLLLALLDYAGAPRFDLDAMLGLPRYHHQFLPDRIEIEPRGFSEEWIRKLQAKGHVISKSGRRWGNMQAVYINKLKGRAEAASDPRGQGGGLGW
ncbi:MAG TPA: gamma-glutamyltransferase [Burkholderiales bacterium]|nr:gamma-glutamyltransferase [Burkholderiales bacterium]